MKLAGLTKMTLGWRLMLAGTVLGLLSLYFPINRLAGGGVALDTPLDAYIPLWPAWVVPYLLVLPAIVAAVLGFAIHLEDGLYRAFISACWAAILPSFILFMAWPTFVFRPPVTGNGWAADLLRFVYGFDRVNNAFPSAHIFMSAIILLFLGRSRPHLRLIWALVFVINALSTLFTHQHHLLDVLGGMAVGWLAYRFGLWLAEVVGGGLPIVSRGIQGRTRRQKP
jgi:membrane-associated phospholipid phosphatase